MKKRISLFLTVLVLTLSLTACGGDQTKSDQNASGTGQNNTGDTILDPDRDHGQDNSAMTGRDDNTVTAPDTNPGSNPAATDDPSGDSMDRMLRNGLVHDRDGDLLDGENSVTPGAEHW